MHNLFPLNTNYLDRLNQNGFVAYEFGSDCNIAQCYHRKDFYKFSLISGKGTVQSDSGIVEIHGCALLIIAPPSAMFSWKIVTDSHPSYTCILTRSFFEKNQECNMLQDASLFEHKEPSVFNLQTPSRRFITNVFQRMIVDEKTFYPFKHDLLRCQINLLIHEALKTQPTTFHPANRHQSSVATLFVELLERQFPLVGQIVFWN